MPEQTEYGLVGPLLGGSTDQDTFTPDDQQQLADYLQTTEGGGASQELAYRIAGNVGSNPRGNPYVDMLRRARPNYKQDARDSAAGRQAYEQFTAQSKYDATHADPKNLAPRPIQYPARPTDSLALQNMRARHQVALARQQYQREMLHSVVNSMGGAANSLRNLGLAPDVASGITRALYAPTLNHPEMQKITHQVQQEVGQLVGPGPLATLQQTGAAVTPRQVQPQPPLSPDMQRRASAMHVLLGTVVNPPVQQDKPMEDYNSKSTDVASP